jgi:hypothetical protein
MPEAFTYYDMTRRIAAQVPSGLYTLELNHRFFTVTSKFRTIRGEELLPAVLPSFQFSGSIYLFI